MDCHRVETRATKHFAKAGGKVTITDNYGHVVPVAAQTAIFVNHELTLAGPLFEITAAVPIDDGLLNAVDHAIAKNIDNIECAAAYFTYFFRRDRQAWIGEKPEDRSIAPRFDVFGYHV